jgi:hypothetical protein
VKEYLIMAGALLEPIAEAVKEAYAVPLFPHHKAARSGSCRTVSNLAGAEKGR